MEKIRLFLDMDGTLAEWRDLSIHIKSPEDIQNMQEKIYSIINKPGYYYTLKPYIYVVDAINHIISNNPEIEVFILSAVLPNGHAEKEKNAWLDKYLPNIDKKHRIFVHDGEDKKKSVPDGLRKSDFLLDDYTHNLSLWSPYGQGIKILNGMNNTKGTWAGKMVHRESPTLLNDILSIINEYQKEQEHSDIEY